MQLPVDNVDLLSLLSTIYIEIMVFTASQKEMEKEKPREDVVVSLLNQIFASRREEIVSDSDDVLLLCTNTGHEDSDGRFAFLQPCSFFKRWERITDI